jgi:hypothetical protein
MKKWYVLSMLTLIIAFVFVYCNDAKRESSPETAAATTPAENYGGYNSAAQWGEHLVSIAGCNDCHSPKKMTPMGPEIDSSVLLAGHMTGSPQPDVDRKMASAKGLIVTTDLTAWVGPWGISYTANLTSDETGIGSWKEEQFIKAIREGKLKGLDNTRPILPPMPWQTYKYMRDEELKAIFAYLKSTKPIKNVVPQPVPPAGK